MGIEGTSNGNNRNSWWSVVRDVRLCQRPEGTPIVDRLRLEAQYHFPKDIVLHVEAGQDLLGRPVLRPAVVFQMVLIPFAFCESGF